MVSSEEFAAEPQACQPLASDRETIALSGASSAEETTMGIEDAGHSISRSSENETATTRVKAQTTAPAIPAELESNPGYIEAMICGSVATLACAPGDETRLQALAATVDRCGGSLIKAGFGGGGGVLADPQFLLMTALVIADELETAQQRLSDFDAKLRAADMRADAAHKRAVIAEREQIVAKEANAGTAVSANEARRAFENSFAEIVSRAAKKLEAAAGRLESR
jgi:cell division protein ZapA (FtsZ GTPase activity inhibitor)